MVKIELSLPDLDIIRAAVYSHRVTREQTAKNWCAASDVARENLKQEVADLSRIYGMLTEVKVSYVKTHP
jgi:hypothetical protein